MRASHDEYDYQILATLESGDAVSQRSLASRLGIALGLTNLLVQRLARRGFIRVIRIRPRRVRYLLTPAGIAAKAAMSQAAFSRSVHRYREARDRVLSAFDRVSASWPAGARSKPVVFLGTGEVAEIGYICLHDTDLTLAGVIDDRGRQRFFQVPVYRQHQLSARLLDEMGGARLIAMSLARTEDLQAEVTDAGIDVTSVVWL